jgi:hypothetical protein
VLILEDELSRLRLKYEQTMREKELIETKSKKDLAYWKDRAEELADYSSEQLDKYGMRENERRVELRENASKAFDALL